jgi:hypothetical protein
MDEKIYAEYIGLGNYLPGVPMKDMTKAEWEAVNQKDREMAVTLGLYRIADRKPKADGKPAENKE